VPGDQSRAIFCEQENDSNVCAEITNVDRSLFMEINLSKVVIIFFFLVSCAGSATHAEDENHKELANVQKYEWVTEEILQQLSDLKQEVKGLKSDIATLQQLLASAPKRPLVTGPQLVKLHNEISFGDPNAKIAIVEFTDYQCPYCGRHTQSVLPIIKKQLIETGKAKYVMYDFPLGFHAQAKPAAIAARCAGQQDKYWEMHDALFKQQRELGLSLFRATASEMELDEAAFSDCLSDPTVAASVDSNFDYGGQIGVSGTPKFFVGKVKNNVMTDVIVINGAQGFSAFSSAIARLEE